MTDHQVKELIDEASNSKQWIMAGYDPSDWDRQRLIKTRFPEQVMTGVGLHPWYVSSDEFSEEKDLQAFADQWPTADWGGEIGLDHTRDRGDLQRHIFQQQLEQLAGNKPVVLHVVQAHGDALKILSEHGGNKTVGFVHGFTGAPEVAHRYEELGFLLSFGPGILKAHYKKAKASLHSLPLSSILIETDGPDDAKNPLSNENNINLVYRRVLEEVASIKKVSVDTLQQQVKQNIEGLLGG